MHLSQDIDVPSMSLLYDRRIYSLLFYSIVYWASSYSRHHCRLLLYLLVVLPCMSTGGQGVLVHDVKVPQPGISGRSAQLECLWSAGAKGFYSVRWYKDGEQFYSFIPQNYPEVKVDHNLPGVTVYLSKSNEYIVTLRKIDLVSEGVYRCEVMSEAPTFQTSFASANLTVVEMPGAPQIIGMQESYTVGETLRLNCTVPDSRPPARISFSVNGRLIHPGSGRITEYPRVDAGGPGHPYALSTTRSQLTLPLGERHVPAVTVECEAQVLSLTTHASHSAHVRPLSTTFSFFNAGSSLPSALPWRSAAAALALLALR
ncbi:uncharacterized protein LOC134765039 [Penaeus indicus]|uniref:uncharacterized protein LOC134765039 n=1 Tax=Penaeus indicus TaxID=29960 RepID=UPI00300CACD4